MLIYKILVSDDLQDIKGHFRQKTFTFLLVFTNILGYVISYHFHDITISLWIPFLSGPQNNFKKYFHLNMAAEIFFKPAMFLMAPLRGFPLQFCNSGWARKTRIMGLPWQEEFVIFSHFDRLQEYNGQSDTSQQLVPHLCIASHSKHTKHTQIPNSSPKFTYHCS